MALNKRSDREKVTPATKDTIAHFPNKVGGRGAMVEQGWAACCINPSGICGKLIQFITFSYFQLNLSEMMII